MVKGRTACARLGFLLIGMVFAAGVAAFSGEELDHLCLDPSDNGQRIVLRSACQTFADASGYRAGVFRPCDRDDIRCDQATVCAAPEINYVCIGYAPDEGDCTTNADCSKGSYCKKEAGYCSGRGMCEEIPPSHDGGCPGIYDPVCGCDSVTYSSSCEATLEGVNVQNEGSCR
jgi:hypothetical protein